MRRIELVGGDRLEDVAARLVELAPARADFNGIEIMARHATTQPRDIVTHYHLECERRAIVWRASPAGKRAAAEREQCVARAQSIVDACLAELASLRLESTEPADLSSLLDWLCRIAPAVDDVDVVFDRESARWYFGERGWAVGANVNAAFDGADARNFAGWIVGQWLACWYPGVDMFVEQWRERFIGAAS